jgi:hypothetical protein
VKYWQEDRRIHLSWAILLGALATCVFLWGLQYKLSLYDLQQTAAPHFPSANLLSKNEQSDPVKHSLAVQTTPQKKFSFPASLLLGLIAVLFVCMPQTHLRARAKISSLRSTKVLQASFFVRPPPSFGRV